VTRLIDLLGDDGSQLRAAGEAAMSGVGLEPAQVELLAPVPAPPSIRDFMAFEEHVVTASAAIGLTVDPLWYHRLPAIRPRPRSPRPCGRRAAA
jgi:hypothetical protein